MSCDKRLKAWLYPADQQPVPQPLLQNFNLFRIFFFQFTGSLLFGYGICCATTLQYGTFLISLSLWIAICWGGELTGGHFNGAVTLGFVLKRNGMSLFMGLIYVFAQTFGVFVGNFLAFGLNGAPLPLGDDSQIISISQLFLNEVWGTFIFVFFILHCTDSTTTFMENPNFCKPFIPLILYIARSYAALTGSLNPSVAMGMQLYSAVVNQPRHKFSQIWQVTVLGPLAGGALAALVFQSFYKPMMRRQKQRQSEIEED